MTTATLDKKVKEAKKAKKSTKIASVNVIAILDMSGSMAGKEEETRGGINAFVKNAQDEVRKDGGKVTFSLTCFDNFDGKTVLNKPYTKVAIDSVRPLTAKEYTPRGGTPLLDAIGMTISPLSFPKGEKVMVLITTDGQENQSTEWTREKVNTLIAEREKKGWEFMFLGVGLDAFAASSGFSTAGMRKNSVSLHGTGAAVVRGYSDLASSSMSSLRSGGTVTDAVAKSYGDASNSYINRSVADQRGVVEPNVVGKVVKKDRPGVVAGKFVKPKSIKTLPKS